MVRNGLSSVYTTTVQVCCIGEYNYGIAYPTAKVKSAKCHYKSNPPNILPAKISGYTVFLALVAQSVVMVT